MSEFDFKPSNSHRHMIVVELFTIFKWWNPPPLIRIRYVLYLHHNRVNIYFFRYKMDTSNFRYAHQTCWQLLRQKAKKVKNHRIICLNSYFISLNSSVFCLSVISISTNLNLENNFYWNTFYDLWLLKFIWKFTTFVRIPIHH